MATNGWSKSIPMIQKILALSVINLLLITLMNITTSKMKIANRTIVTMKPRGGLRPKNAKLFNMP
jgi:hypothetical protein